MELVIVTGMSGAGKSTVAKALEDIGFYCVDNIPPRIVPAFVDLSNMGNSSLQKIAIVTDIRGGEYLNDISSVLEGLKTNGVSPKVLFLDTSDDAILRRYKENRRNHPLYNSGNLTLSEAVKKEREVLQEIRQLADFVVDTTYMNVVQLKQKIAALFTSSAAGVMNIHCMSFGFKYGFAAEADIVFDVRCLPNPFYDMDLRPLTGLDEEIKEYVLSAPEAVEFYNRLESFIEYSVPMYQKEGKSSLVIAFGCTGGQHRSVTFAELTANRLMEKGYAVSINHRDIKKDRTKV